MYSSAEEKKINEKLEAVSRLGLAWVASPVVKGHTSLPYLPSHHESLLETTQKETLSPLVSASHRPLSSHSRIESPAYQQQQQNGELT